MLHVECCSCSGETEWPVTARVSAALCLQSSLPGAFALRRRSGVTYIATPADKGLSSVV